MPFFEEIRELVLRLRSLPENQKKIILFTIIIVSALIIGFFTVISTNENIKKIGKSIDLIDFPKIDIYQENPDLQGKKLIPETNQPNTESDNNMSDQSNGLLKNQNFDWQMHTNKQYDFIINYPKDWSIDNGKTTDLHIWLEKKLLEEVASLHIEVVSQTQKIKSSEDGSDYIVSQMKNIIKPKEKINVGEYEGYEVVGTICTGTCNGSPEDMYFPFSVIYFSNDHVVIKVKYSEGVLGLGWKKEIKDWKFYDEYKGIISNIKFIK